MLKKMIEERGKSVYAVSKESGIPYTTLNELVIGKKKIGDCSYKTISSLASYFGLSTDNLFEKLRGVTPIVSVNQTWLLKKRKQYRFPVIKQSPFYDASKVHPLKQKLIFELANMLTADPRIDHSILFGGSTTIRCNKYSDIDIAVFLKKDEILDQNKDEISEKIEQITNWNADIVWGDRVETGSGLENSLKRGVYIK